MLDRRAIAVSPDKGFAKRLAVALRAAGAAAEACVSPEELASMLGGGGGGDGGEPAPEVALVVLHTAGLTAADALGVIGRLTGETKVIAILPRPELAAVVELMQGAERIAGMMAADDFDAPALSAMATRVLDGELFGLEKLVRWGTKIHECYVADYQEKSSCIAQVSEFAEHLSVRRKYREGIEQALDEMLMNALYDAPVDEHGTPVFAEISTRTRTRLRGEQQAIVQYACDGRQFVMSVRDAFGRLDRATVLRYLHKCLHSEQQIDRKTGGAGLGLYLITCTATDVYFHVQPGVATEAVCAFDLEAPKLQLARFGFFTEPGEAAEPTAQNEPAAPAARTRRAESDEPDELTMPGEPPAPPELDASDGRPAPIAFAAEPPAEAAPRRSSPAASQPAASTAAASHPELSRAAPAGVGPPRGVIALLLAAIALTIGLAVIVAWPRLATSRAAVTIGTVPPGATIELEGRPVGTTASGPLAVRDLERGRAYAIVARLDGHEPRQAVVQPRGEADALTLELAPLAATVVLESAPPEATVEIDGKPVGATPLTLRALPPGRAVQIAFKKPGYRDATARLDVPRPGKELRLIQPLVEAEAQAQAPAQAQARIRLSSDPPGARVAQDGRILPGVTTPAEVEVEPNRRVRFVLTLPNRVPAVIDALAPAPGATAVVRAGRLPSGAPLRVAANAEATLDVAKAPHCRAVALPAECVLAPGTYAIEVKVAKASRLTRTVRVGSRGTELRLELGYVDAGPGRLVVLPTGSVRRAAFEAGPQRVKISDGGTTRTVTVNVRANATVTPP